MADEKRKTVWILGAGFSRSLGGPLLSDMLSEASELETLARYETVLDRRLCRLVHMIFRTCARSGRAGAGRWGDAEQFLDYLDVAQSSEGRAFLLEAMVGMTTHRDADFQQYRDGNGPSPAELCTMGRRILAAECCGFLRDASLADEAWQPYVRWAGLLDSRDTVVTFNYDRVLERLAEDGGRMRVVTHAGALARARDEGVAPVYKLHGSVDWCRISEKAGDFADSGEPEFALNCTPEKLALATPGPTKRHMTEFLGWLWGEALKAIRRADHVILVGYRFPPSDSEARRRIWNAFRKRREMARVELCLGHDINDAWSRRAAALIQQSEHADVDVLPFLAEDYLSIFQRE